MALDIDSISTVEIAPHQIRVLQWGEFLLWGAALQFW